MGSEVKFDWPEYIRIGTDKGWIVMHRINGTTIGKGDTIGIQYKKVGDGKNNFIQSMMNNRVQSVFGVKSDGTVEPTLIYMSEIVAKKTIFDPAGLKICKATDAEIVMAKVK